MTEAAWPGRGLTRAEVREVDRKAIEELGVPGVVLMENAGLGLTDAVERELRSRGAGPGDPVGIVCGRGNNGGDGFVLARHLDLRGFRPQIAYCGALAQARRDTDAGVNLTVAQRGGIELIETPDAASLTAQLTRWGALPLLVDAVFGTGLTGELKQSARLLVEALAAADPPKLAVDIPSGLDCDLGVPLGAAVRAVRTVTFVAPKAGFEQPGAAEYTGEVEVVAIGCPRAAWSHVVT